MLRVDGHRLCLCCCDESSSGQVIGFSEESSGALMDGGNSGRIEEILFYAGYREVMLEVLFHFLSICCFEVASGDDSGSQRLGGTIHKLIYEVGLSCQDNR